MNINLFLIEFSQKMSSRFSSIEKYINTHQGLHRWLFRLSLLFIFSIIFFLNYKTPLIGDDYVYSFVYETSNRLSSIKDIFESQYLHYFQWGGRSVVHAIVQLLLFTDNSLIIDIINSVAFVAFIYLMYLHIDNGRKSTSISILFITFSLIWLLQPTFAETTLWITGSANYLWGTLIILTFLLPYRRYKNNKIGTSNSILYSTLMFLSGIIAGWTNENTAAGMIVIIFVSIIYYRYKDWKTPTWAYMGLAGAIIGYIIMIIAPGNFVRAAGTSIDPFLVVYRTLTSTQNFINYLGILNLGVSILLVLYFKFSKQKREGVIPYIIIYTIGLFVSIYVMVASPGFPPRAWFGCITFNIIIFGIVLTNQDYSQAFFKQIKNCVLVFCVLAFGFSFYDAFNDVNTINNIWKERMTILEQKKKEGAERIVFKEYQAKTKFGLGDAPYAKKHMSQYYNIDFDLE